jgi:DNA-binding beta-propeller fold protein YncE
MSVMARRFRGRRTKGLLLILLMAALAAVLAGCGGKYEMPTETSKEAHLGEYVWGGSYDWFQGGSSMAVFYGHIYIAYPEEGTVMRYYSNGAPEKDIVFTDLAKPFVIGAGTSGIAVADSGDGMKVKIFALDGGAPVRTVTDPKWEMIGGLALDDAGNVYVSDMVRNFVRSYNLRGNLRFGTDLADSGFGIGHVLGPQGLWVEGETLLIAEAGRGKSQIQKISTMEPQKGILFSSTVPLINTFAEDNGIEYPLLSPTAVTTDKDGRVFILDAGMGKLFRYTADGVPEEVINSSEAGGPQSLQAAVAIGGYNNRVYTLETATGTVQRWDSR